jgi:Cd2+/Zn2+-exporting ATPase
MPGEKERHIAQLQSQGEPVMMVGDGVNDAPSLVRASIGVAMGGLGSEAAMNAADVVLTQDSLRGIPKALALAKASHRITSQSLFFALGVIAVLALGSLIGDSLFTGHRNLLLPLAVLGHEGSTVLVILNGLRLLRGPSGF